MLSLRAPTNFGSSRTPRSLCPRPLPTSPLPYCKSPIPDNFCQLSSALHSLAFNDSYSARTPLSLPTSTSFPVQEPPPYPFIPYSPWIILLFSPISPFCFAPRLSDVIRTLRDSPYWCFWHLRASLTDIRPFRRFLPPPDVGESGFWSRMGVFFFILSRTVPAPCTALQPFQITHRQRY